jgi:tetratricopeptide (TPR) repeat protein
MRMLWIVGVCGCALASAAQDEAKPAAPAETKPAAPAAAAPAGDVRSLLASGQRSLMGEKWEEAIPYFEQILQKDPANDEARFGLGTAYGQTGKYKEALELLEALIKSNPDNASLKNNIAWIYAKAKDPAYQNFEKAVKLAREAVLTTPVDYNIWNTLAEAYYGLKDYDRALRSARHALQLAQLAGVPDEKPYRELLERCQDAAESETKPK